jgi:hypothetical protein
VTEDEFWAWIEDSRRDGGGVLARQVELLRQRLLAGGKEVLLEFRDRWNEADDRVFTWPLWDAACLLLGWVSDDFFDDVRAWIISHGRAAVDRVVAEPDSLVDLAFDRAAVESGDAERLNMLLMSVWREISGDCDDEMPDSDYDGNDPTGERTDLKDEQAVRARFPRLAEFVGRDGRRG